MGIDAIICATTSRALTRWELVECSRRLLAAVPEFVSTYGDVPEADSEPAGDFERDTDRDDGGLCIQYRAPIRLDDFEGLPPDRFVYEICTLSRSVYLDGEGDPALTNGVHTGGRGSGLAVAAMGEALDLLMAPGSPWPRGPAPDWRIWYGSDASYSMHPFDRDVRRRMFTAYLRSEIENAYEVDRARDFAPCPLCGSRVRSDYHNDTCAACRHDLKTGKKRDPYLGDVASILPRSMSTLSRGERCALMRSLGEVLGGRGLNHSIVDALKSYEESDE